MSIGGDSFAKNLTACLIRILDFPQLWGNRPDEEGKVLFEAECRLRTFAGAVLSESQRLLEKHSPEGYLGMWHQHEFPLEKQETLRQASPAWNHIASTGQSQPTA